MRIYNRLILLFVMISCSLLANGEQYIFIKGQNVYEICETKSEYRVYCSREGNATTSRNKNITDRQLRMDAVDLIGSFIIYKSANVSNSLPPKYFQIYVEGLDLHYYAVIEGIRQEYITHEGRQSILYSCDKEAYDIKAATYNSNIDIQQILLSHYKNSRCEEAANLLYEYESFTSDQYLGLERDYLSGDARVASSIRSLQGFPDRFEESVFSSATIGPGSPYLKAKSEKVESAPYSHFWLEEMVTSAPLAEKERYYSMWRVSLNADGCIYESILKYCSEHCSKDLSGMENICLSDVIEAFPGAISPFGMRQPINDESYNRAAKAYSLSNFEEAADLLKVIINNEGISTEVLNLIGASYRNLNQNHKAIPYLLLCMKLSPKTQYLSGNLYLTLKSIQYSHMDKLKEFLNEYNVDNWSKSAIE